MLLLFTVMGALSAAPDASTPDRRTAVAVLMIAIAGSAPGLRPTGSPVRSSCCGRDVVRTDDQDAV